MPITLETLPEYWLRQKSTDASLQNKVLLLLVVPSVQSFDCDDIQLSSHTLSVASFPDCADSIRRSRVSETVERLSTPSIPCTLVLCILLRSERFSPIFHDQ